MTTDTEFGKYDNVFESLVEATKAQRRDNICEGLGLYNPGVAPYRKDVEDMIERSLDSIAPLNDLKIFDSETASKAATEYFQKFRDLFEEYDIAHSQECLALDDNTRINIIVSSFNASFASPEELAFLLQDCFKETQSGPRPLILRLSHLGHRVFYDACCIAGQEASYREWMAKHDVLRVVAGELKTATMQNSFRSSDAKISDAHLRLKFLLETLYPYVPEQDRDLIRVDLITAVRVCINMLPEHAAKLIDALSDVGVDLFKHKAVASALINTLKQPNLPYNIYYALRKTNAPKDVLEEIAHGAEWDDKKTSGTCNFEGFFDSILRMKKVMDEDGISMIRPIVKRSLIHSARHNATFEAGETLANILSDVDPDILVPLIAEEGVQMKKPDIARIFLSAYLARHNENKKTQERSL